MMGPVLISWVAVNNDPFERERGTRNYRTIEERRIPGPTLTLLFDEESPYCGRVGDVVLFFRSASGSSGELERHIVEETIAAIRARCPGMNIAIEAWPGNDPTDHKSIFEFLRAKMPELRRRFRGRELVVHLSPGTPSMQTIWVLMVETGFVEPPVVLVKSYRAGERRGRPAVVPVEVGIETFYKAFRVAKPSQTAADDDIGLWEPARFRTERLRSVFVEARRYAQLRIPILILGERGTGKTTVANWIRLHSPYRRPDLDSSWPSVPCGQYSPETMRAELFGYRKGAFTDAKRDKTGLLATAHGDTVFLDEIGDISRDLQRLLIRALEEGRFFPLGDDRPQTSEFRLLTATNLAEDVLKSRLDLDFLDRISALTISMPPLREIPEELPWLWDSVYAFAARRAGATPPQEMPENLRNRVVGRLRRHPLPGNVRDLFRVAYRLLAALGDAVSPLPFDDAVDYGLQALNSALPIDDESQIIRSVARRFANSEPVDDLVGENRRLPTALLEANLKKFVAVELRRLSKQRSLPISSLCDVTERTLRKWATDA